jgi:hypothetical protein
MSRTIALCLTLIASLVASSAVARTLRDTFGDRYRAAPGTHTTPITRPRDAAAVGEWLQHWNQVAIDTSGLDHTPVAAGETRVFGEQLGPGRSSRAMAIVHIAVFEAVNAHAGQPYRSYVNLDVQRLDRRAAAQAAIARAAHDTLVALYPSQAPRLDAQLAEDLTLLPLSAERDAGLALGARAAAAINALRANDGTTPGEARMGIDYLPGEQPGAWRQDPVSRIPLALGMQWGAVQPFVIESVTVYRVPPPPALTSAEYAAAYEEVQRLGGDGIVTPTERTAEQTAIGIYWAYDGTPSLCAPPRLYNQLARTIAERRRLAPLELARLLALINVAMADAAIASWESKYYYAFWRPVTGIREADAGPSGLGDDNPATAGDPGFTPLGAPASNLTGPNFTPPFPSYPSGHATFGGALFETLRRFFGTDAIAFTFVSDEFNGVTVGNDGVQRALVPRRFSSLSQAEEENGQSRVYLGIHWSFDKTTGIAQGRAIARDVVGRLYAPQRRPTTRR